MYVDIKYVEFLFLPPNTTSLIQPMDQGVIATAKAIYKKITFQKAHETHETLADFLKDYDVLQAVNNFANAWRQITRKNMRAVWNPLLKVNYSRIILTSSNLVLN